LLESRNKTIASDVIRALGAPPAGMRGCGMASSSVDDVRAHYALGEERGRLESPLGKIEFARTVEIVRRHLPPPPAVVADVGGGPGRYALWLADSGYRVRHRDLVGLHVEQLTADAAADQLLVETAIGDARSLDLPDSSVDAVLLLGPLYHLTERPERVQALAEAARIVRPGGPVYAAAISRWAPRLHGELVERLGERFPAIVDQLESVEETGLLPPLFPGSFSGYCHRPQQLRSEIRAAGMDVVDLVSVEGLSFALSDLEQRLANPDTRSVVLDAARVVERTPELLGLGPHLLATARRPQI
jgi:SAM-dependent methyltransferase